MIQFIPFLNRERLDEVNAKKMNLALMLSDKVVLKRQRISIKFSDLSVYNSPIVYFTS